MDNLAQKIGFTLAMLREEHGFTQDDIQKLTGVNRTTYSKNESGKTIPSLTNMKKFAKIYGVSIDFLCGGDETSPTFVLCDSGRNLTKEERMLIAYFRLMDEKQQKELLEMLESDVIPEDEEPEIKEEKPW